MTRVFLSYRHGENAARWLFDELCALFREEELFLDRSDRSLPAGVVWPGAIESAVRSCRVMLVLIGRHWQAERLRQPDDPVRREVSIALARGAACLVIPVRVDARAELPRAEELPEELRPLCERQIHDLLDPPGSRAALDALLRRVDDAARDGLSEAERERARVEAALGSRFGVPWERSDTDSPHSYDYKYVVVDPAARRRLREELRAHARGDGRCALTLEWLRSVGERRKYLASEQKAGTFLQASAILTRGEGAAEVLVAVRADFQHHLESEPRHVKGESCLIATALCSFEKLDAHGHVPSALFRSLREHNPWALFGRKLVVPGLSVQSRFLGVGYNFEQPTKEYVHLIWHVHCDESTTEAVLVPARERSSGKQHDQVSWQPRAVVEQLDFESTPIDRALIDSLLDRPTRRLADATSGFLPGCAFEATAEHPRPVRHQRDAVVLDLLLLFQQRVHFGLSRVTGDPLAARAQLETFLLAQSRALRIEPRLEPVDVPGSGLPPLLRFGYEDASEARAHEFLVAFGSSDEHEVARELVAELREALVSGFESVPELRRWRPEALFLLHLVRGGHRYACQGSRTILEPPPIHVVRVAFGASAHAPVKDVAHALLALRGPSGAVDSLLFTRGEDDPSDRLPGGKLKAHESPEQGLRRELQEELGLDATDLEELVPVLAPNGDGAGAITLKDVSPSSGLSTVYNFHPFVARLSSAGLRRLGERLSSGASPALLPRSIEEWHATGFGFSPEYARQVLEVLPARLLERCAFDWPPQPSS